MTTTNSLFVFPATGQQVRTVMKGDAPWFVAGDVCAVLRLENTTNVVRALSAEERMRVTRSTNLTLFKSGRGSGSLILISESGLYKLVLRAHPDRVPAVRQFQDWVTRDVLPAIRKDGVYVRGEELLKKPEALELDDLDALRDQIERLMSRKAELLEQKLAAVVYMRGEELPLTSSSMA